MTEGLFSRWAKRKHDVAAANEKDVAPMPVSVSANAAAATTAATANVTANATASPAAPAAPATPATNGTASSKAQPLPSIESLTPESDFAPFMAKDVAPDMRNQAMKKLFTNPHYNVMDGLDIYIDDYGKPDPLPEGWLQLMNQSKTLRLFETIEEEAARLGIDVAAPQKASIAATAQSEHAAAMDDVAAAPSTQVAVDGVSTTDQEQPSHDIPEPSGIAPKWT
jgi:hypothetical protein